VQDLLTVSVTDPSEQSESPLQPVNVDPEAAVAVSATTLPVVKLPVQVVPQFTPEGELVTVPLPFPDLETERLTVPGADCAVPQAAFEYAELPAAL
jgi:hypothetical protein